MICPKCGGKIHVSDSVNAANNEVYRRRQCYKCHHEFYTVEREIIPDDNFMKSWKKNHRYRARSMVKLCD